MIYVFGDMHLRDSTDDKDWSFNQKGLYDYLNEFEFGEGSSFIQLGDFFHSTRTRGQTNYWAHMILKLLSKSNKRVYILQGNHEVSRISGSNLDTINTYGNVSVVKDICVIERDGFKFLFISFIPGLSPGGPLEKEVNTYLEEKGIKEVDYIFGHHFFEDNTIMDTPYLNLSSLNLTYKTCIQGHNHQFKEIKYSQKSSDYCLGAISPMNKGEANYKFFYMGIDKSGVTICDLKQDSFRSFIFTPLTLESLDMLKGGYEGKDFIVATCRCKRSERFILEPLIYNYFKDNLYELEWDYIAEEEEFKVEDIDVKSDKDLVTLFFKENEYTKDIKMHFWRYYNEHYI
jgi:DNA repair exonuclease SbcCD nuclease subunit